MAITLYCRECGWAFSYLPGQYLDMLLPKTCERGHELRKVDFLDYLSTLHGCSPNPHRTRNGRRRKPQVTDRMLKRFMEAGKKNLHNA